MIPIMSGTDNIKTIERAQAVVFLGALITAAVTFIIGVDDPKWLLVTVAAIVAGVVLFVWLGNMTRTDQTAS
jgi:hypothetical protein